MKKRFLTLILVIVSLSGSQHVRSQAIQSLNKQYQDYLGTFRVNPKSDGLKGTPFLFDTPPLGKIALDGGKDYSEIPFNILLEKNEVYIQTGGEDSEPLLLRNWKWIEIPGEEVRSFRIEYLQGKPQVVEILFEKEGEKYIASHKKTLIRPSGQRDGYSGPQYDEFRHNIKYFKIKGMQSAEIKTNSSGLKEWAGNKNDELKEFIKENKLDPNQPLDMKKIISFIVN
ncbi:hypothetical protein [Aquiflexum gelatinilyticum]|uniref:Uncharacterized protein n=1 Tax=Aquiflexum gelatinilyticum TaxID=2961943 RepID=A0A9X2P5R6_9BACT|nr:hypothetical protein [Aquiflexum gelatinilyticum]MCR9015877.1 hypothetical protein [Aquiflexum gelatinilyticum]